MPVTPTEATKVLNGVRAVWTAPRSHRGREIVVPASVASLFVDEESRQLPLDLIIRKVRTFVELLEDPLDKKWLIERYGLERYPIGMQGPGSIGEELQRGRSQTSARLKRARQTLAEVMEPNPWPDNHVIATEPNPLWQKDVLRWIEKGSFDRPWLLRRMSVDLIKHRPDHGKFLRAIDYVIELEDDPEFQLTQSNVIFNQACAIVGVAAYRLIDSHFPTPTPASLFEISSKAVGATISDQLGADSAEALLAASDSERSDPAFLGQLLDLIAFAPRSSWELPEVGALTKRTAFHLAATRNARVHEAHHIYSQRYPQRNADLDEISAYAAHVANRHGEPVRARQILRKPPAQIDGVRPWRYSLLSTDVRLSEGFGKEALYGPAAAEHSYRAAHYQSHQMEVHARIAHESGDLRPADAVVTFLRMAEVEVVAGARDSLKRTSESFAKAITHFDRGLKLLNQIDEEIDFLSAEQRCDEVRGLLTSFEDGLLRLFDLRDTGRYWRPGPGAFSGGSSLVHGIRVG